MDQSGTSIDFGDSGDGSRDEQSLDENAWKRGYLLYGPPGIGKSSPVAAMANNLKFHIYELQLILLKNNDLRSLMVSTANISILLIEDIDNSIESKNQQAPGEHDDDSKVLNQGFR